MHGKNHCTWISKRGGVWEYCFQMKMMIFCVCSSSCDSLIIISLVPISKFFFRAFQISILLSILSFILPALQRLAHKYRSTVIIYVFSWLFAHPLWNEIFITFSKEIKSIPLQICIIRLCVYHNFKINVFFFSSYGYSKSSIHNLRNFKQVVGSVVKPWRASTPTCCSSGSKRASAMNGIYRFDKN